MATHTVVGDINGLDHNGDGLVSLSDANTRPVEGTVSTDNSSASSKLFTPDSFIWNPEGDTARGLISGQFTKGEQAKEDWIRQQQSLWNSYVLNVESMREQNKFNASESQKARDFEERMSNTAYQRGMADMQAAGINPILAFQQGGASVPTVSSASSGSGVGASSSKPPETENPLVALILAIGGLIKSVKGK